MWQFGLTLWEWSTKKLHFIPHSYAIYLWPGSVDSTSQGDYRRWSLQLSSVQFLVEHGFDFNKALSKGCWYLSRYEEEAMKPSSKQPRKDVQPFANLKEEDQKFLQEMAQLARDQSFKLDLPSCNSYQRFLIYQHLPVMLEPQTVFLSKIEGNAIRVALSENEGEERLEERVGVRRIIDAVLDHRLPIVGHNCWLDLMHFWQKFIQPLPRNYGEWKKEIYALIPKLIDTKYLASVLLNLESTSLGDLTEHFVEASLPIKRSRKQTAHFHDAGYDSLCTGQVFLGMMRKQWPQAANLHSHLTEMFNIHGHRLHMMQSDYPYINLAGDDVEPDRSTVLVITDFLPTCTTQHLQTALATELPLANLSIQWIDQQYAMVILENAEMVQMLLGKSILVLEKPLGLLTFAAYQERKKPK